MRGLLVLIALLAIPAGCREDRADPTGAAARPAPSSTAVKVTSYEGTEDGLRRLMQDLLAMASQDPGKATTLARSLAVDEPELFFRRMFGEELGTLVAAEYAALVPRVDELVPLFTSLHAAGQTQVVIERFSQPDDPASVEYQSHALKRMLTATPLYSVRLTTASNDKVFHLWSFVYQAGGFRWVGKLKKVSSEAVPKRGVDLREYRLRDFTRAREALRQ